MTKKIKESFNFTQSTITSPPLQAPRLQGKYQTHFPSRRAENLTVTGTPAVQSN